MLRRRFFKWFLGTVSGIFSFQLRSQTTPLSRINTTLFSSAEAAGGCNEDGCSTSDSGLACRQRDVCAVDKSGGCRDDHCATDESGDCTGDRCTESDSSRECSADSCTEDKSGRCTNDICVTDKSGDCTGDRCTESDSSGACESDFCESDSSGECTGDYCVSDSSRACRNDSCMTDKSGECTNDVCTEDRSGDCISDQCQIDASASCERDVCASDSSGACTDDSCTEDATGSCGPDACLSDASNVCAIDRCTVDRSGVCAQVDLCIVDESGDCTVDICREDRGIGEVCSLDSPAQGVDRENLSKAIRWLYKLGSVILIVGLSYGQSMAQIAIDATDAVFHPTPAFTQGAAVKASSPPGPFLRDCDSDGILEADVNGDGLCDGDPKVADHRGNGTRELPPGTTFQGTFDFTCFHIPSDVAIITTGPLNINASREVAVFGVMMLGGRTEISSPEPLDLRSSVWLAAGGNEIILSTAAGGIVSSSGSGLGLEGRLPAINYLSACDNTVPMIRMVSPPRVTIGSKVTLKGTGLGKRKGRVFLAKREQRVLRWTQESVPMLLVDVPAPGIYNVKVKRAGRSGAVPLVMYGAVEVKAPAIDAASPNFGVPGAAITLTGTYFGSQFLPENRSVRAARIILGGKECAVKAWSWDPLSGKSQVRFRVPRNLAPGAYKLVLKNKVGRTTADFTVVSKN